MSHNATCTYNTPYRRKRYAVVQGSAEQRAADAENKIKALEDQLQVYKKKIHSLEKNLLQYLSPVIINQNRFSCNF
jgi:chaperonin cofactor prefoldin